MKLFKRWRNNTRSVPTAEAPCGIPLTGDQLPRVTSAEIVSAIESMAQKRVPHNVRGVVVRAGHDPRTAEDLVRDAGASVPALATAMETIAGRFVQLAQGMDQMNRAIGEFKHDVIAPFREELRQLRYNTGDRLTHVSTDLEAYVSKLDKVLWGALRAQGLSDDAIRTFRTEHGMQPEAPRGYELAVNMAELDALRESNARLAAQNQRLLARLEGIHVFDTEGADWSFQASCRCSLCKDHAAHVAELDKVAGALNSGTPEPW